MQKNNQNWIVIILLVLVVLLLVPQVFAGGRGYGMHAGYGRMGPGMMGPGMMGFGLVGLGWLFPAVLIILVIAAGVWLGNRLSGRASHNHYSQMAACSKCSQPLKAGWVACPHCGQTVKK